MAYAASYLTQNSRTFSTHGVNTEQNREHTHTLAIGIRILVERRAAQNMHMNDEMRLQVTRE